MDFADTDEMCTVGFIEAVQIRGVLEVVGIQITVFQSGVRKNVVIINDDLQVIAFFSKAILDEFQNFSVRG